MLVALKRLREINCFKFPFKRCGAGFIANVGRESVPYAAGPEKENALSPNLIQRRGVE